MRTSKMAMVTRDISIGRERLDGALCVPERSKGLVIFAHGSGSSRLSPRNRHVAAALNARRLATLLFDLLTSAEAEDRGNVFDIGLLGARVVAAIDWATAQLDTSSRPIGLFGASTGAAAALVAASERSSVVAAVVSRGGRPDLAGSVLPSVRAPTLLLVGGEDYGVIELNQQAYATLRCEKQLVLVPGATHLFEEPGTLDQVVDRAGSWFETHFGGEAA